MTNKAEFKRIDFLHLTKFKWPDISFGIHISMDGRVDVHFLIWVVSIGNVPVYEYNGKEFAASNSYHKDKTKTVNFRAGTPTHGAPITKND